MPFPHQKYRYLKHTQIFSKKSSTNTPNRLHHCINCRHATRRLPGNRRPRNDHNPLLHSHLAPRPHRFRSECVCAGLYTLRACTCIHPPTHTDHTPNIITNMFIFDSEDMSLGRRGHGSIRAGVTLAVQHLHFQTHPKTFQVESAHADAERACGPSNNRNRTHGASVRV